jgi:hypothetical protein
MIRFHREIEQLREMLRQFTAQGQPPPGSMELVLNNSSSSGALLSGLDLYDASARQDEMKRALQQEQERVDNLQRENESLRNELWSKKSTRTVNPQYGDVGGGSLPAQLQNLPKILASGSTVQVSISVG